MGREIREREGWRKDVGREIREGGMEKGCGQGDKRGRAGGREL